MKYLISAGHTPSGTLGCGAVDLIDESNCTREVAKLVVNKLKSLGHEVHLLQFDRGNNYNCEDCYVRSNQANSIGGDLFVEIHFNSGINRQGDGCEVLTISNSSIAQNSAKNICNALSNDLGITNRGVKSQRVIVLSHTNMPAILVECMFVDGKNADSRYNADKISSAIVSGLTGQTVSKYKIGWNKKSEDLWWYCTDVENGYYYNQGFQKINDIWYYFLPSGYIASGWKKIGDDWYYFNTKHNGHFGELMSGWITYKGKKCYLNEKHNGTFGRAMQNETIEINGVKYSFDNDCYLIQK